MDEIREREKIGLSAKPIDDGELTKEIVLRIKDKNNSERNNALNFLIYNISPGTTASAKIKGFVFKRNNNWRSNYRRDYSIIRT